jgi:hypothetical protein
MRNKPTLTEVVRDAALNNDMGIDRALVLVERLYHAHGKKDDATKKAFSELVDILARVRGEQRLIHQTAEQQHRQPAAERQDAARQALEEDDTLRLDELSQFL